MSQTEYVETPAYAVVPFPFNFALFNSTFGTQPDAPNISQKRIVSDALQHLVRAGAEQIADTTGLTAYTVRKRLTEIDQASPTTKKRRTRSGRSETVWAWQS